MSSIDALVNEVARRRWGVLGLRELRSIGVSDEAIRVRVDDGRLRRLHRGVFALGPGPVSPRGRWRAATLAVGPSAFISHRHGAAVQDLAGIPRGPIDVLIAGRRVRGREGIRARSAGSLASFERDDIDGIPVTSIARTLLDYAAVASPLELQRAYERAERIERLDLAAVRSVLRLRRGHRGAARLRSLIAYDPTAAAQALSELERLYLDLLRGTDIPEPEVNVLVDGHLVDCYWPAFDLVVELDSYEFHGDREAFERDRAKIADLRRAGHEAVQFTYRQVTQRPEWVVVTTRALARDAVSTAAL